MFNSPVTVDPIPYTGNVTPCNMVAEGSVNWGTTSAFAPTMVPRSGDRHADRHHPPSYTQDIQLQYQETLKDRLAVQHRATMMLTDSVYELKDEIEAMAKRCDPVCDPFPVGTVLESSMVNIHSSPELVGSQGEKQVMQLLKGLLPYLAALPVRTGAPLPGAETFQISRGHPRMVIQNPVL